MAAAVAADPRPSGYVEIPAQRPADYGRGGLVILCGALGECLRRSIEPHGLDGRGGRADRWAREEAAIVLTA